MTWFRVDDQLHGHVKTTDVSAAAMGLWVMAGSWASAQLSDGFVPARVALRLYPEAAELASELVAARLWERATVDGREGWVFHGWAEHQPSAEAVHRERAASRDRQRRAREAAREAQASRRDSRRDAAVSAPDVTPGVTGLSRGASRSPRPDPTRPEGGHAGARASGPEQGSGSPPSMPPARRCPAHLRLSAPGPCPACADARRDREDYDAAAARAPTPTASSPPCPAHPHALASRCQACQAEAVPPPTDLRSKLRRPA